MAKHSRAGGTTLLRLNAFPSLHPPVSRSSDTPWYDLHFAQGLRPFSFSS
jgi:hypothetical protein